MALHAGHMRASTQPLKLTEGSVGSLQNKMRNVWGEPLYIYIYGALHLSFPRRIPEAPEVSVFCVSISINAHNRSIRYDKRLSREAHIVMLQC